MEKDLARCVGLWLAEGDTKSVSEITFTNNCFELVELFYRRVQKLFESDNFRLYVYRSDSSESYQELNGAETSVYIDERATQPYYMIRLASRDLVERWKKKVLEAKDKPELYPYILQGFFAGEGSVYEGAKKSRRLRISQGEENEFLEELMNCLGITYYFRPEGRSYVITKKYNWDIFDEYNICKLHPRKREKFQRIYSGFQEEHYQKGELKENTYRKLVDPYQTKELAEIFDRSQARLCDVLMELKKEAKIMDYRSGSQSYWIRRDQNTIIISEIKEKYLELLRDRKLKVGEIADHFSVTKSSAYKNLHSLQDLGLIKKKNHEWKTMETEEKVIVL